MNRAEASPTCHQGYRHEAFFYDSDREFMGGTLAFVHDALAGNEPILVVLEHAKIDALRSELGVAAEAVCFADMAEVGRNPARIIPAWQDYVDEYAAPGRRLWGIGEPIWAARSPAELVECQRHEALLNLIFADAAFSLLCPYDTAALDRAVIDEARRNHPWLRETNRSAASVDFPGAQTLAAPFDDPLPPLPPEASVTVFAVEALHEVRQLVRAQAAAVGLCEQRAADLVLAVNEIATNSLMHGGGAGTLWIWREVDTIICEVRDKGRIEDPLAGRRRPAPTSIGGRGLWLANQLCDLVQVRAFATHGVVRLHMRIADLTSAM